MAIPGCRKSLSFDLPICMPLWLQQLYAWYHYLDVPHIFQSSFTQSFTGWRRTGRTYWRMVQLSRHGQVMESNAHTYARIGFIWTYRKTGESGGEERERELNTLSGSLVERAMGLAPYRLICESLLLKQLCASAHTLCRHRGSSAFTHLHINKPPETFIKCRENRRYLHVETPGDIEVFGRGHTVGLGGPANPLFRTGNNNVQLPQLPIAVVVMESNTLLTLLELSTQPANLK